MRFLLYGYIVLGVCTGYVAESYPRPVLTVLPTSVDVTDKSDVTVTCSLDTQKSELDQFYSILISRTVTTIVVCFKTGNCSLPGHPVTVEKFTTVDTIFLQIRVRNVTCADRGDYSCKLAVRQKYRNKQITSDLVHLNVTGKPSDVYFEEPSKLILNNGTGVKVVLRCSTLQRSRVSDWVWRVDNQTTAAGAQSCAYSDIHCLYRCSSSLTLLDVKPSDVVDVACSVAGLKTDKVLNISSIPVEQNEVSSETESSRVANSLNPERGHPAFHTFTFAGIFGCLALFVVVVIVYVLKKRVMRKWSWSLKRKNQLRRNVHIPMKSEEERNAFTNCNHSLCEQDKLIHGLTGP